jgi:hypothetical protein
MSLQDNLTAVDAVKKYSSFTFDGLFSGVPALGAHEVLLCAPHLIESASYEWAKAIERQQALAVLGEWHPDRHQSDDLDRELSIAEEAAGVGVLGKFCGRKQSP